MQALPEGGAEGEAMNRQMNPAWIAISVIISLAALVVFAAYVTRNGPSAPRVDPWH